MRPRKIKYRNGEITLKNILPEDADLLTEIINQSKPMLRPWEQAVKPEELTENGLGLLSTPEGYVLVTLKYNLEKKVATVEKQENIGTNYNIAMSKAKVEFIEKLLDKCVRK
jgi:hypothetical protein